MRQSGSSMAVFMVIALLAASALPRVAQAQGANDGAIQAAFHACAGQPLSIKARLQALNAANWIIADYNAPIGELFALAFASEYREYWVPGEGKQRKASRAGLRGNGLVSRIEPSTNGDVQGAKLSGGEPAHVEAIVKYLSKTKGSAVFYYQAVDGSAALRMLILPQGDPTARSILICDLYMSTTLTLAEVDNLLPDALRPADLRKELNTTDYEKLLISYNTPSGIAGKLTVVDATKLTRLKTYISRFTPTVVLSTICGFEARNLSMTY